MAGDLTIGLRRGEAVELGGVRWCVLGIGRRAVCLVGAAGELVLWYGHSQEVAAVRLLARRRCASQIGLNIRAPRALSVVRCGDGA